MWSSKAPWCQNKGPWRVFHLLVTFPFIFQGNNLKTLLQWEKWVQPQSSISPHWSFARNLLKSLSWHKPSQDQLEQKCQSQPRITQDHSNSSGFTNTRDNPTKCSPNPSSISPSLRCKGISFPAAEQSKGFIWCKINAVPLKSAHPHWGSSSITFPHL